MPTVRVPIPTLNGGVSRRESSKRLPQEVENADNVLLTVERSAEKRPPLSHIKTTTDGNYLDVPNIGGSPPPSTSGLPDGSPPSDWWNMDNLYFHFIDVDGANRYCVVINRAVEETNLMVRVFRIEPTEWHEEEFDRFSFDRGLKEYLMHYNLKSNGSDPIEDIMGSITYGTGAIFWNKKKKMGFLPDNSGKVKALGTDSEFLEPHPGYIHSGDKFHYKTADMFFVDAFGNQANGAPIRLPNAIEEDVEAAPYEPSKDNDNLYTKWKSIVATASGGGYKNVDEDIESRVNSASLESYEVGHSLENFSKILLPPPSDDINSHAGWKAMAATKHLYHRSESGISNTVEAAAAAATGTVTFNDSLLPTDDNVIVIQNPQSPTEFHRFAFDRDHTYVANTVTKNSNGHVLVGLSGVGDGQAGNGAIVATRFATMVNNVIVNMRITAQVNTALTRKVDLVHIILGSAGNVLMSLENAAGDTTTDNNIVLTGFSGGEDAPDYGYLTSPFPTINGTDSIYEFPNANTRGKGEIWYARDSYFTFPSGFYRTVSNTVGGQPYFQPVRAEDKNSVVDHRTMPVIINKESDGVWRIRYMPIEPKRNGTSINNPGPEAIKNNETIKAMEFWKNRLWIATDTSVFSSKSFDFFDYFIGDIQNISESDPIDLSVNTGQFNRIQSLTSFQNFLFITTKSGTQFEIRGSATNGGAVSPTSVELRSTSFYSSASTANPVKMGNNIFFFDTEKLFLYSGSDAFGNEYSTAYELSEHARGYLPENFQETTAIPSRNSIVMVDKDYKNHMYIFTSKTNGQQLVQNAYYRWVLDPNDSVLAIQGYEKGFYAIVRRSNGPSNALYAYYGTLAPVTLATPLLDRLVLVDSGDIKYNAENGYTEVTLPYFDGNATEVVLGDDWGTKAYSRFKAESVSSIQHDSYFLTKLTIRGNVETQLVNGALIKRRLWAGRPYTMDITLSPLHYRRQDNSSYPGVLNLKRLITKHKNTGEYTLEVQRYNRKTSSVRSETFTFNDTTDLLGEIQIESEGEMITRILGYASSTTISIKSDFPTPCNITSLDVIGNFRPGDTSIQK